MKVSFEGIGETITTFYSGGGCKDAPVKLTQNGTVAPCANGETFIGVGIFDDTDYSAVRIAGFTTMPYSGTAPALGFVKLVADGNGGVKTGSSGESYLVLETGSGSVGFML